MCFFANPISNEAKKNVPPRRKGNDKNRRSFRFPSERSSGDPGWVRREISYPPPLFPGTVVCYMFARRVVREDEKKKNKKNKKIK